MSRPIVFLDCDGVLANSHAHSSPQWCDDASYDADPTLFPHSENAHVPLECPCLEQLGRIVQTTGADVVLTTTWRHNVEQRAFLVVALATYGVHVIGDTPNIGFDRRGDEVVAWLKENTFDGRFVILDDGHYNDFAQAGLLDHLVITIMCDGIVGRPGEGLTQLRADVAIKVLSGQGENTVR